ncbi:MAG: peptidylprolyl isomerase, partial [Bacteroidetes bacterium]|nr:peptidylprolyl isomerase [Bacteroidota bacterium]
MKLIISLCILFSAVAFVNKGKAQQITVDKVIANVGNYPILLSDLEIRFKEEKLYLSPNAKQAKCDLLYRMVQEKLMLVQAERDSVVVSADDVEAQLDQRIGFFSQQLGGDDKLEEYFNKPMVEIKSDLRENLKNQLTVQKMRGEILGNISVTPSEVKKYYRSIPKDSLPYYKTEVEVGQIVIFPKVNNEQKEITKKRLLKLRQDILKGRTTFADAALLYSDDLGSQVNGGDLDWANRGDFVPEFSAAAFRLKKDSISGVVETQFGLHIIKLIERRGDNIHCAHVLMKPRITEGDKDSVRNKLDSIRNWILKDTLTFEAASYLFSEDEQTKNMGGMIYDQESGSNRIPMENLEKDIFKEIKELGVG